VNHASISPLDQAARDRVSEELHSGHFVQAGAGSGKTTQIITRIIALVGEGIPLSGIAAITFTEKAAADLRRRLRDRLEKERNNAQSPDNADLLANALDSLDAAPIGTIHSFARRLLAENPIEARVPPGFEVRSDLATSIDRQALWQAQRQELFRDPELRAHVEPLLELGVTESTFEEISVQFDDYWDRLESYAPREHGRDSLAALRQIVDDLIQLSGQCLKPEKDSLAARIAELTEAMALFDSTDPSDIVARGKILYGFPSIHGRSGAKTNWPDGVLDDGRLLGQKLKETAPECFFDMVEPILVAIQNYFRNMSLNRAKRRRLDGTLNFQDLLVLARNLLRSDEDTWARLAKRYPRVIVDEFQDTDPLQADIVCRLAAVAFEPETHWSALELRPGALLTVGDPKQSIYRFRGADINTYFSHRDRQPGASGQDTIELTTNFRSTEPVLEWVNAAFGHLIQSNKRIQPGFVPLVASPAQATAPALTGAPITLIGQSEVADTSAKARANESRDVAHAVLQAIGRIPGVPGWTKQVRDGNNIIVEPVTLSDICILIPSRTSLPPLESALRQADIEFVSEASSVVYSTIEIQSLLFALRAVANTADEASLVLALRSPLFGIGDDDLLHWHTSEGKWSVFDKRATADSAFVVGRALHTLQRLVYAVPSLTPSDVLERLVNECSFYEKALFAGSGRRAWWRRVRYVIDQAEAWYQTTGGSLRDYLAWAAIQQDENTRVTEAISPEIGDDALHIMTVHMAKGLEFPMVILAGGMSGPKNDRPTVLWDDQGRPQLILSKKDGAFPVQSTGYQETFEREKEARQEEYRRLYYVACTRAESHLVVSGHCHSRTEPIAFSSLLSEAKAAGLPEMASLVGDSEEAMPVEVATRQPLPTVAPEQWWTWQEQVVAKASAPRSVSVTSLAHGGASSLAGEFFTSLGVTALAAHGPSAEDIDRERVAAVEACDDQPAKKKNIRFAPKDEVEREKSGKPGEPLPPSGGGATGAGGAAFGKALHWVMETSDLVPGEHIRKLVDRAAKRFAVEEKDSLLATVEAALANETVIHARYKQHWLELSLQVAYDGVVVEGFADLVYEEDDGSLVVVDFKTDRVLQESTLESYWAQLSAYSAILSRVTRKKSDRCVIVHCPASGEPARTIEKYISIRTGPHSA